MGQTAVETNRNISTREARIGIVGLGYVGLPLMLRFVDEGFYVLGIDVDAQLVEELNAGRSSIAHIPAARVSRAREGGFEATTSPAEAASVEVIIICVPTPLGGHREPDLTYVLSTAADIAPYLQPGTLV